MNETAENTGESRSKLFINTTSVLIPLIVIVLLVLPSKFDFGEWTKQLPHAIGLINMSATVALVLGLFFIKINKVTLHRISMSTAFILGIAFLFCYVSYHLSNPAKKFGGSGLVKTVYLILLLTHVLLSLAVLPLVLRAMYHALTRQFEKHKRIVKYAYPIWLYVTITGVIVYLMLNQLYTPA